MTTWGEFIARLVVAFFLGSAIGMEKKWRKTTKIIKFTTLLSIGAATYIIAIDRPLAESNFIILGISVICASIILQKKSNSQNIDLAIILWCSGIVGLLIGSGLFILAYASTLSILIAKFLFPIETQAEKSFADNIIMDSSLDSSDLEQLSEKVIEESKKTLEDTNNCYHCQIVCDLENEANILASMVQSAQEQDILLAGLKSDNESATRVKINADFVANNPHHSLELQKIFHTLKSQIGVNSVSWHQVIED